MASWTARHFGSAAGLVRLGLRAGKGLDRVAGAGTAARATRLLARLTRGTVPAWIEPMPGPAPPLPATTPEGAAAVYFPSCLTRAMGALDGETTPHSTARAFVTVAARAGVPLVIPETIAGLCCGTPYSSKGFDEAHSVAINATIAALWTASREGVLPIVVDTSPCTYGLVHAAALSAENKARAARLRIVDAIEFFAGEVLPRLAVRRQAGTVTLHPVCSLVKMGLAPHLVSLAAACSKRVYTPPSSGCCGFAGDRGWLLPELTASATAPEAAEVRAVPSDGCYSSSRTCEIGMTRATGRVYRSWIHLLDWATSTDT
jgi:D-lactate dehydrogenase